MRWISFKRTVSTEYKLGVGNIWKWLLMVFWRLFHKKQNKQTNIICITFSGCGMANDNLYLSSVGLGKGIWLLFSCNWRNYTNLKILKNTVSKPTKIMIGNPIMSPSLNKLDYSNSCNTITIYLFAQLI